MPNYNEDNIMDSLENTMVCIEMFIMAVAAGYAYTYKDFLSPHSKKGTVI